MEIKNIIFDLGGVIYDIRYENIADRFRTYGLQDFEQYYTKLSQTPMIDEFEEGRISPAEFRDYIRSISPIALSDEQIDAIVTELGLSKLDDAEVYGYNPSTSELVVDYAGYDGWRAANGDFHNHTGNAEAPVCAKWVGDGSIACYNIASETYGEYVVYWALANDTKAVLVKITFTLATAINSVDAEQNEAKVIFDLSGRRLTKAVKGVNIINGKKVLVK